MIWEDKHPSASYFGNWHLVGLVWKQAAPLLEMVTQRDSNHPRLWRRISSLYLMATAANGRTHIVWFFYTLAVPQYQKRDEFSRQKFMILQPSDIFRLFMTWRNRYSIARHEFRGLTVLRCEYFGHMLPGWEKVFQNSCQVISHPSFF